ncbi:MAG: hypothetical protein C5B50_29955 [Verrucomicrobia bacterium]|nr:MAG: hypothetical protein C5B50_29955 [Verrucomicrobiota bacterium]
MNLLDENIRQDQAGLLRKQGVKARHISFDLALRGIADENLIPLLHRLKTTTLFTHDEDYFKRDLVHSGYCLVWLNLYDGDAGADYPRLPQRPNL